MVKCAALCQREGTIRCTGCSLNMMYCSEACQTANWPSHIFVCYSYSGKTVPTAYHLARSCFEDLFPTDKQTLEDYGFNRAYRSIDKTMLLGLYQSLFKHFGINPETVHTWRQEGILIQEIKKVFEEIPPHYRGSYYQWFLEHQDLLDPSLEPSINAAEDFALETIMRAWRHIGGRPLSEGTTLSDINNEKATWPIHRRDSFDLLVLMLSNFRPHPSFRMWLKFGFCTTPNEHEEMQLSLAYHTLLMRCTFKEFCQAYESCSLVQLFASKNINLEQFGLHLVDFLAHTPYMNKSVWDLKQFVVVDESDNFLLPPAGADYGFYNCRTQEEVLQLKEFYKKVFEVGNADPLMLHQACVQGKIYDYVRTILKLQKKYRRPSFRHRLINSYPLPPEYNISHLAGLSISVGDIIGNNPRLLAPGSRFAHWGWPAFIVLVLALVLFYFY